MASICHACVSKAINEGREKIAGLETEYEGLLPELRVRVTVAHPEERSQVASITEPDVVPGDDNHHHDNYAQMKEDEHARELWKVHDDLVNKHISQLKQQLKLKWTDTELGIANLSIPFIQPITALPEEIQDAYYMILKRIISIVYDIKGIRFHNSDETGTDKWTEIGLALGSTKHPALALRDFLTIHG